MNNLDKKINILNLSTKLENKLKEIQIFTIRDLWIKNKIYLKENNIKDSEIKEIRTKLQLISLDLNKKIYSK